MRLSENESQMKAVYTKYLMKSSDKNHLDQIKLIGKNIS